MLTPVLVLADDSMPDQASAPQERNVDYDMDILELNTQKILTEQPLYLAVIGIIAHTRDWKTADLEING